MQRHRSDFHVKILKVEGPFDAPETCPDDSKYILKSVPLNKGIVQGQKM